MLFGTAEYDFCFKVLIYFIKSLPNATKNGVNFKNGTAAPVAEHHAVILGP